MHKSLLYCISKTNLGLNLFKENKKLYHRVLINIQHSTYLYIYKLFIIRSLSTNNVSIQNGRGGTKKEIKNNVKVTNK